MVNLNRRAIAGTVALLALAWCPSAGAADTGRSLDDLLKQYKALGLPLPPPDAKLVRYVVREVSSMDPTVQRKVYGLAFQLKTMPGEEYPLLLSGVSRWQPYKDPLTRELKPEPSAIKDLDIPTEEALPLAIQCQSRGWNALARHLFAESQKERGLPLDRRLDRMAWSFWVDQLTEPETDRAPAAKYLKELIGKDKELDTEDNRALLKSLELTLIPSKAKPGSVEALIDNLVNHTTPPPLTYLFFEPGEPYGDLANRGFEAVPALIEHLDDERLTRAWRFVPFGASGWHLRVGDVAGEILQGMAGQPLGQEGFDRQGYRAKKADAEKWWAEVRKIGEEKYLLDRVLPPKPEEGEETEVNMHLLNILLAKYPKHVPTLYRTALDKRPDVEGWPLAEAILRCPLSAKEKLDLLRTGVRHRDIKNHRPALLAIRELDKKEFDKLLIATINNFPKDIPGEYGSCEEAAIAGDATDCEDPRVWRTLEKVARRSSVGLRMELLGKMTAPSEYPRWHERLHLLAGFLDDETVRDRDSSKKFGGGCAGGQFRKLEVRNFVAYRLAYMTGVGAELEKERTPNEWVELRAQVRKAVDRELARPEPREDK